MAEGKDPVLYAMPFCAGNGTGILVSEASWFRSDFNYIFSGLSSAAAVTAAAWLMSSYGTGVKTIMAKAVAASFFCGLFCWFSFQLPGAAACGGSDVGYIMSVAEASAESLGRTIDEMELGNPERNALIKALLTGNRSGLPENMVESFRLSGASHLLALSGMHLGIIYSIASKLLAVLGKSRYSVFIRYLAIVSASAWYSIMTGASPSIIRALIFITVRETAMILGRSHTPAGILCFALTVQSAAEPSSMLSVSFQLSYLAMCGIYFIHPRLKKLFRTKGALSFLNGIWNSASLSISCQITTGPLAWARFGSAPAFFILTNMIAVPLTSATIPLAIAAMILRTAGVNFPPAEKAVGEIAGLLISSLETVAGLS